jgi:site-specific DNA-methyltransferase (adenine-specific)
MFSAKTVEWPTPRPFVAALDAEFGFTLDPCATPENAVCARYFTVRENGLAQSWAGETAFMNPPFGRAIGSWVGKAYREAQRGATVVCLLPVRSDTAWWHAYVMRAAEIRFVRKRIQFGGSNVNAPFPCAVVVFRRGTHVPAVGAIDAVPAHRIALPLEVAS